MITLTDDKRTESFQSLIEAVEAAKTWYTATLLRVVPKWYYKIETFNDLLDAIEDHKVRLAQILGYGEDYHIKLRLRATETKWV